jgi:hypothetical protein
MPATAWRRAGRGGAAEDLSAVPVAADVAANWTGQPYRHLRELRSAGLVVQRRRSGYAVPAGRAIPCLVLVAAAQGCAHVREFAS